MPPRLQTMAPGGRLRPALKSRSSRATVHTRACFWLITMTRTHAAQAVALWPTHHIPRKPKAEARNTHSPRFPATRGVLSAEEWFRANSFFSFAILVYDDGFCARLCRKCYYFDFFRDVSTQYLRSSLYPTPTHTHTPFIISLAYLSAQPEILLICVLFWTDSVCITRLFYCS